MERGIGPVGQYAQGIQPTEDRAAYSNAGAAVRQGDGASLQPVPVLPPDAGKICDARSQWARGGVNLYGFGAENPNTWIDPLGLVMSSVDMIGNFKNSRLVEGGGGGGGSFGGGSGGGSGGAGKGVVLPPLPNSALVCRGGSCKADNFENGSGVTKAANGTLSGVSVQSAPGLTVGELGNGFPHPKVGVTTVGKIRGQGGEVTSTPRPGNINHAEVTNLTPQQLECLMKAQVNPNPAQSKRR